jgi:hypothetical protein
MGSVQFIIASPVKDREKTGSRKRVYLIKAYKTIENVSKNTLHKITKQDI